IQAEYSWAGLHHVQRRFLGGNGTVAGAKAPQTHTCVFGGGYVQLSYLLTGENRSYDKRLGRLDTYYLGKGTGKGPFTNAWFVKDEDGRFNYGLGAWELAARWSYLNLND